MTNEQFIEYIVRGHRYYWDMLGNMRGNINHKGSISWLSGDIYYAYSVVLDGPDYPNEIEGIIKKMISKEIPDNLVITPDSAPADIDICGSFLSHGSFKAGNDFGMAKELYGESTIPMPPKNINIFRVNENCQIKMCGAILNTAFAYDLFSFEHYLDAFNTPYVRFYIAECNGIPAGACMSLLGDDFVEIAWVGTLNGYRKKGIAGYLIDMAEKDAVREGKFISVISAFPAGVNAYKRIGYKEYCDIKVVSYIPVE